jgi:predicted Zn-dependent peptidase
MEYFSHTLPNGLRVILKPDNMPVSYCGIVINAGSRDEDATNWGMAHFIEHMLFKGTRKRSSTQIINRLEDVGGELNAFTSKEETVVYATVLTEHTERAIELLADITFQSIFPEKEVEKELVIIQDEIQSYNDSPSELIFDEFEELMFADHAIGHNILGKPELLDTFTSLQAGDFIRKYYRPEEMVLFVLGNLRFEKIVKWAERYCVSAESPGSAAPRIAPQSYQPIQKTINKNTFQAHVLLGNRACHFYHPDRMGLYLLNNILGGPGMNSLLNMSLRERNGLVYNVESSFQPMTDTGMWTVYYGCDPENEKRCEKLVYHTLQKLIDKQFTEKQLEKYKLQLIGQMAIASENKENLALSIGKSFLRYNKIDDMATIRQHIHNVTSEQLHRLANEVFNPEQFSVLKFF